MTSCDVVFPDGTHHAIEFGRVPVANERIELGASDDEEQTPLPWGQHHGKRFHVGGVTWKTTAPGFDAQPTVYLVGGTG